MLVDELKKEAGRVKFRMIRDRIEILLFLRPFYPNFKYSIEGFKVYSPAPCSWPPILKLVIQPI